MVFHDLLDSTLLQSKASIGAVTAIVRAKLEILRNIKDTDNHIVKTAVEIELAIFESIKAAKLVFFKTFANKIVPLLQKLPGDTLSELMQLPLFDYVADMLLMLLAEEDTTNDGIKAEGCKYNLVLVASNPGGVIINKDIEISVADNNLLEKSAPSRHPIRALLKKPSSTLYKSLSSIFEAPPVQKT